MVDTTPEPELALAATAADVQPEELDGALDAPEIADAKAKAKERLFGIAAKPVKIDRFVVVERLGRGGMGVVYVAYDPQLDRKVALKLLRHQAPGNADELTARLVKEAQAMARVSHPNVITVHEVGTFEGKVFIAMEFVDGLTLRSWVEAETRSWATLRDAFFAIGDGLAAAHRSGLVHRDFKPDNVMIAGDGRVSVLDFGLAKLVDEAGRGPREAAATQVDPVGSITQTGTILGTPAYMAPEQHAGATVDARADQFSFCVALFEAVFGRRPFAGESYAALAAAVCAGEVEEPADRGEMPARAYRAMLRGLSADPEARFASMEELLAEVGHRPRSRRRTWLVLGGAGLLAAASAMGSRALERDPACEQATAPLDRAVHADRLASAQAAFDRTGLPYAPEVWGSVRSAMDDYAARWNELHLELCGGDSEVAEDERAGRLACLGDRARELGALTQLFSNADGEVVERAVEATAALTRPSECATEHGWRKAVRLPDTANERAAVVAARTELAHAKTLGDAGKMELGEAAARAVLDADVAATFEPLAAEAGLALGRLQRARGRLPVAEATLTDAVYVAIAAEHESVALAAASELVWIVGSDRAAFDAAIPWMRLAESLATRSTDQRARTQLGLATASMFFTAGRGEEASKRAAGAAEHAKDPALRVTALLWQARFAARDGQIEPARAHLEHALALSQQDLPATDPTRAQVFVRLGGLAFLIGDNAQAREHWEQAVAIEKELRGEQHPAAQEALVALAVERWASGDSEGASEVLKRTGRGAAGVQAHLLRADLALDSADAAMAESWIDRALSVAKRRGPHHPAVAEVMLSAARVAIRSGDLIAAEKRLAQVRSIQASRWSATSPVAHRLTWLAGELLLAQGEPARAAATLNRAEAGLAKCCDRSLYAAWARAALARALAQAGKDPERAEQLRLASNAALTRLGRPAAP